MTGNDFISKVKEFYNLQREVQRNPDDLDWRGKIEECLRSVLKLIPGAKRCLDDGSPGIQAIEALEQHLDGANLESLLREQSADKVWKLCESACLPIQRYLQGLKQPDEANPVFEGLFSEKVLSKDSEEKPVLKREFKKLIAAEKKKQQEEQQEREERKQIREADRRIEEQDKNSQTVQEPQEVEIHEKPVSILESWHEIFNALEMPNNDQNRHHIRRLNKLKDGPINLGTQGQQPKVKRNELIRWHNGLADRKDELEKKRSDAQEDLKDQHNYSRNGKVFPSIKGHEKKRRKDRKK